MGIEGIVIITKIYWLNETIQIPEWLPIRAINLNEMKSINEDLLFYRIVKKMFNNINIKSVMSRSLAGRKETARGPKPLAKQISLLGSDFQSAFDFSPTKRAAKPAWLWRN